MESRKRGGLRKYNDAPRSATLSVRFSSDVSSPVLPEKKDDVLSAADSTPSNVSELKVSSLEDKVLSTDEILSSKPKRSSLKNSDDAPRGATPRSVQFNPEATGIDTYSLRDFRELRRRLDEDTQEKEVKNKVKNIVKTKTDKQAAPIKESEGRPFKPNNFKVELKADGEEFNLSKVFDFKEPIKYFRKIKTLSESQDNLETRLMCLTSVVSKRYQIKKLIREINFSISEFKKLTQVYEIGKISELDLNRFKEFSGAFDDLMPFDDNGNLAAWVLDFFANPENEETREKISKFYFDFYQLVLTAIWSNGNLTPFILEQFKVRDIDITGKSPEVIRDLLLPGLLQNLLGLEKSFFARIVREIFVVQEKIVNKYRKAIKVFSDLKYSDDVMFVAKEKLRREFESSFHKFVIDSNQIHKIGALSDLIIETSKAKNLVDLKIAEAKLKFLDFFRFLNDVKKFNNSIANYYSEDFANLILNDASDDEIKKLHNNLKLVYQEAAVAFAAIKKIRELNVEKKDLYINKIVDEYADTLVFLCKTKDVAAIGKLREQINTTNYELRRAEKSIHQKYSKVVKDCANVAKEQLTIACQQTEFPSIVEAGKKVHEEAATAISKASKPEQISNISKGIRASALLVRKPSYKAVTDVAEVAEKVPGKYSNWKGALSVLCLLGAIAAIIAIPCTLGGSAPLAAKLGGAAAGLFVASGWFGWMAQAKGTNAAMQNLTTTAVASGVVSRTGLFRRPAPAPALFSDTDYVMVDRPAAGA